MRKRAIELAGEGALLRLIAGLLAVLGVLVSGLLVQHHRGLLVGAFVSSLGCGKNGPLQCDVLLAHDSSAFLGVPWAIWGLAFYVVVLGISGCALVLREPDRAAWYRLGAVLGVAAVLVDAYLAWVMVAEVGKGCFLCLTTYVLNLLLALVFVRLATTATTRPQWGSLLPSWRVLTGAEGAAYYRDLLKLGLSSASLLLLLASLAWAIVPLRQIRAFGESQVASFLEQVRYASAPLQVGGLGPQPSLGPEEPEVDLILISDLQCDQCATIARTARELQSRWPLRLRLRFLNSPLHSSCNPTLKVDFHAQTCWLAELGECAERAGCFWEFHELAPQWLGEVDEDAVWESLSHLPIESSEWRQWLASGWPREEVQRDVTLCEQWQIQAVPTTIVNGHPKPGSMFPWMLEDIVAALLEES